MKFVFLDIVNLYINILIKGIGDIIEKSLLAEKKMSQEKKQQIHCSLNTNTSLQ